LFHWPKEKRFTLTARSVMGRLAKLERRL